MFRGLCLFLFISQERHMCAHTVACHSLTTTTLIIFFYIRPLHMILKLFEFFQMFSSKARRNRLRMGICSIRIRIRMERPIIRFFECYIQIGYSLHSVLSHVLHTVVIRCSIRHIQYFVFDAINSTLTALPISLTSQFPS